MGYPLAAGNEAECAIEFANLTLGYERHPAVHHLNCNIARGALVALVGPNGAGKSTLFKGIMGTIKPISGNIAVHSCNRKGIAYLPQTKEINRTFPITVHDLVAAGLWQEAGLFRNMNSASKKIIEAFETVGLEGFEKRQIGTLSGGQFQRALFARTLLQDSPLVLLDEPLAGIDQSTVERLIHLIHNWHAQGRTVIVSLHDLEMARNHFPETMLLSRDLIAYGRTEETLTLENLTRASKLREAFDENADLCTH